MDERFVMHNYVAEGFTAKNHLLKEFSHKADLHGTLLRGMRRRLAQMRLRLAQYEVMFVVQI
jgi:hypothetical protein